MNKFFFDGWESTIGTIISTLASYIIMILLLRASGKRTLSKMNAFDFIVTIALGSVLATIALNKNVTILEGGLAIFVIVFAQYFVTWLSVRTKYVKRIVTSEPVMLLYSGRMLQHVMKKERITEEEIYAAARKHGHGSLDEIDAIVLETTGDLIVISKLEENKASAMKDVSNFEA